MTLTPTMGWGTVSFPFRKAPKKFTPHPKHQKSPHFNPGGAENWKQSLDTKIPLGGGGGFAPRRALQSAGSMAGNVLPAPSQIPCSNDLV